MTCGCPVSMGNAFSFIAELIPHRLYFGIVHPDKCPNNTRKKDFLYFKFNVRKIGLYFGPPHIGLVYKYIKELNHALRRNPKKIIVHVAFTTEKKMTTNSAMLIGAFAMLQLNMDADAVVRMFASAKNLFLWVNSSVARETIQVILSPISPPSVRTPTQLDS